eukprot:1350994-Amorphochlora_amoeboformis.AAC.1
MYVHIYFQVYTRNVDYVDTELCAETCPPCSVAQPQTFPVTHCVPVVHVMANDAPTTKFELKGKLARLDVPSSLTRFTHNKSTLTTPPVPIGKAE